MRSQPRRLTRPYPLALLIATLFAIVGVAMAANASGPPAHPPAQEPPRVTAISVDGVLNETARQAMLEMHGRAVADGSLPHLAGVHAAFARDALARVAPLTAFWLDHRDPATGLFPTRFAANGRIWTYGDTASDLFPFLAIATRWLHTDRYSDILAVLDAERALSPGFPIDIPLVSDLEPDADEEKRFLGATEYAKDGLLPLVERLGPDPWLGRLIQVTDRILEASVTPTQVGPIPASSTEINGNMLQVLSRLYWVTRDPRYFEMGQRIAAAYLEHQLPTTEYVPSHRWDFIENNPIGPRRFFLGDHGNEIVTGLVEWHRIETELNRPEATQHRQAVHRMLDRLITRGRTPDGLWVEVIDVPSGRVRDDDLTDNWGYLAQAYLHQAQIERYLPGGDIEIARRYEREADRALNGVSRTGDYPWDDGQMDGVADTVESALYAVRWLESPPAATTWIHQEVGRLMAFQRPDGRVLDDNIDGNFIRTSLLYAEWLTQGVRISPWSSDVAVGAVRDGPCLHVHLEAAASWSGRVTFDGERHRAHLELPSDYPRLNQWTEWFAVSATGLYDLAQDGSTAHRLSGTELVAGQPLTLESGQPVVWRVCPASAVAWR